MRKIYWRRLSLLNRIFSVFLIVLIIFTIVIFLKQQNFTLNTCHESRQDSFYQGSTIPARYLLIPYREFAYRTSISCNAYKFDDPKKELTKFHPKYSQYLRGRIPIVIPYSNITYDDIENFYQENSKSNQNQKNHKTISFASNITFDNIPYEYKNGLWHPIEVTSAQRTAILVPLKDRDYNSKAFLLNMHAFVRRQLLTYLIVIIEQVYPVGSKFNKGRLLNTGVRYIQENQNKLNITCLILHDTDLIPENDGNFYTCESIRPKHTTLRVQKMNSTTGYERFYEFLVGGVLILTIDMYKHVNGFSNLFWGWGGEDDDLSLRFIRKRVCVVRPFHDFATYMALPHEQSHMNKARYSLLTWSTVRLETDGFNQIDTLTSIVNIRTMSTVTHLTIDVDANHLVHKVRPTENLTLTKSKIHDAFRKTSLLATKKTIGKFSAS